MCLLCAASAYLCGLRGAGFLLLVSARYGLATKQGSSAVEERRLPDAILNGVRLSRKDPASHFTNPYFTAQSTLCYFLSGWFDRLNPTEDRYES